MSMVIAREIPLRNTKTKAPTMNSLRNSRIMSEKYCEVGEREHKRVWKAIQKNVLLWCVLIDAKHRPINSPATRHTGDDVLTYNSKMKKMKFQTHNHQTASRLEKWSATSEEWDDDTKCSDENEQIFGWQSHVSRI